MRNAIIDIAVEPCCSVGAFRCRLFGQRESRPASAEFPRSSIAFCQVVGWDMSGWRSCLHDWLYFRWGRVSVDLGALPAPVGLFVLRFDCDGL